MGGRVPVLAGEQRPSGMFEVHGLAGNPGCFVCAPTLCDKLRAGITCVAKNTRVMEVPRWSFELSWQGAGHTDRYWRRTGATIEGLNGLLLWLASPPCTNAIGRHCWSADAPAGDAPLGSPALNVGSTLAVEASPPHCCGEHPSYAAQRGIVVMTAKIHERRAIVIGGSIAGLFVGAFLRRIGWRVDVYERSSIDLIGRGVGIFATHLELLEALDKCGAGTVDIGVIVYKRIYVRPRRQRDRSKAAAADCHILGSVAAGTVKGD